MKFLIEYNLLLSVAESGLLFKGIFPDSAIAAKFKCARKKAQKFAKALKKTMHVELYAVMRNKKKFFSTDSSNSFGEKFSPLVITFFDENGGKIKTTFLSVPKLENVGTAKNIFFSY